MSELKHYTGGCHCGKVRYEVDLELKSVIECNCSICSKKAEKLAFVPASQFKLLAGEDALTDYQFNTHNIHHLFCATCGIQSFTRGTDKAGNQMCSINVRCLDNVDIGSIPVTHYDGKHA